MRPFPYAKPTGTTARSNLTDPALPITYAAGLAARLGGQRWIARDVSMVVAPRQALDLAIARGLLRPAPSVPSLPLSGGIVCAPAQGQQLRELPIVQAPYRTYHVCVVNYDSF